MINFCFWIKITLENDVEFWRDGMFLKSTKFLKEPQGHTSKIFIINEISYNASK